MKRKFFESVLLFFKKTNYALSIISFYLHTSETTQYFGFSSSYHHPFMWNFMEKCLHSGGKLSQCCTEKGKIMAAQMSVTNCFFTLTLVKSLRLARALLLTTRFSSFGNLFFCKMLPIMPLSYQGKHKTNPNYKGNKWKKLLEASLLFQWGLGLTPQVRVRSQRSGTLLPLTSVSHRTDKGDYTPIRRLKVGCWEISSPEVPMFTHAITVLLFLVIKLFWAKHWMINF